MSATAVTSDDLAKFKTALMAELQGVFAPSSLIDDMNRIQGWKRKTQADGSFGRILNGPQWVGNVSLRDGQITADKLEASFVVSNTFTTRATGTGAGVDFDSAGIRGFNSGGSTTFNLAAADGSLTVTGTFTVQSATSGARVALDSSNGVRVYDATTLRAQIKPDGSGFLGSTGGTSATAAVAWTTGGVATINADRITTGTLAFGASGTVNSTGSVSGTIGNSSGTLNLGQLTVTGTITLGSGGKFIDADGSTWDQSGITLVSAGSPGDNIVWKVSGSIKGSIYASSTTFFFGGNGSTKVTIGTTGATQTTVVGDAVNLTADTGALVFQNSLSESGRFESTNRRLLLSGRFYPGTGSASQTQRYIDDDGSNETRVHFQNGTGSDLFAFRDNVGNLLFGVRSDKALTSGFSVDATALGAYVGRYPIYIAGTLRYFGIYA